MKITVPELSLVLLVGPSGCGKSTFAQQHFKPTEVLSSDYCRGLVSDNENDQTATKEAFEVLHFIARKRLSAGRLTVIDATNVQPDSRKPLIVLAREFHVLPIAIVFDFAEKICQESGIGSDRIAILDLTLSAIRRNSYGDLYEDSNGRASVESTSSNLQRNWKDWKSCGSPCGRIAAASRDPSTSLAMFMAALTSCRS
jgi:predicted kinase